MNVDLEADIRTGLTIRSGNLEANVHSVHNGKVYYGIYKEWQTWPANLIRATIEHFRAAVNREIAKGAVVFFRGETFV